MTSIQILDVPPVICVALEKTLYRGNWPSNWEMGGNICGEDLMWIYVTTPHKWLCKGKSLVIATLEGEVGRFHKH